MTPRPLHLSAAIAFSAALFPAVVAAQGQSRDSFRISVVVPEFCEVRASPVLIDAPSGRASTTIFESCNIQDGFQIVANHRELDRRERVAISYAGQATLLNASGWSPITNRVGAKHGVLPINIRYAGLEAPLALNFAVTMY